MSVIVVNNAGNFETWPIITLGGTNPVVKNTTAPGTPEVRMSGVIPAGSVLDFAKRTLKTSAGVSLYSQLVQPISWWRLWPGNNTIDLAGGTGSIAFNSAWI